MFRDLLGMLSSADVEFILIGGLAAIAHGTSRATFDVDVVYSRAPENIQRLAHALESHHPYLRGAPPGLPFRFDVETIEGGLNFTLTTDLGPLDLLGEVAGGGTYERLLPHTEELDLLEQPLRCVSLLKLIELKRAAGRPKDLEAIAELEALLRERENQ
jgi:predicted nucleotidyltransferase